MLASITLAILLGPRIVHAEENQTLLSKNDSSISSLNQQLTDNLIKSAEVLQTAKDRLANTKPIPEEVKKVIVTHPLEQVNKTVNDTTIAVKNVMKHSIKRPEGAQPNGDTTLKSGTEKIKKTIPVAKHQDHTVKARTHLIVVYNNHHHRIAGSKNDDCHPKKRNQTQPIMTKASIIQPNERPSQAGNGLSNGSNGLNLLGLLDGWLIHNISFNKPLYLHGKYSSQWENAPPFPPPEQPLLFLS